MELRVAFRTLGCKLNQLETESLADAFRRAGAVIVPFLGEGEVSGPGGPGDAGAHIFVVNTCTVTSKAEQKARRLIRQALAHNPGAVVLVTGCYAQMEGPAIAALNERAVVVPGDEKAAIASLAEWLADSWQGHGDLLDAVLEWRRSRTPGAGGTDRFAFLPEEFAFHSRPSLKIQDGCDNRCSYCRVCLARGASVSLPVAEVLSRLRALEAAGRAEAVLTGVNLSQYRDGDRRFPDLLRQLLDGTERIALRISSFEPDAVNEDFLELFSRPRIRPHIHLAVQSGSDGVLRRMARAYRRDRVLEACEALRKVRHEPFLASDLIAGFPGETEAEFEETLELARIARFAWIHAFPFSPRPGTRAWELRPRVPERVAGERVAALARLAREGRADYLARWHGAELEAVLESTVSGGDTTSSLRHATAENYLKLEVRGLPPDCPPGAALRVRLEEASRATDSMESPSPLDDESALGSADATALFLSRV